MRDSNKQSVFLIYMLLALAAFIAYEPVRHNDFVDYDDGAYVTENPQVNGGITLESFIWAFTTRHTCNWHPLTWLSHMLDCELFGLNPLYHHFVNVLFHIANALLLFWVLKRMTSALWPSAFVAAAFALHPLHVESVAWISERKDVLSTFFLLLAIAAYLRYVRRPSISRYLLTLLTFALGLMAKPMLVTLPFVLLLLDYWPLDRFKNGQDVKDANQRSYKSVNTRSQWSIACRLVWEKVPFFALSIASSVVTFIVQQSGGAVVHIEKLPLNLRVANALVSYISYINKMIYPSQLALFYPYRPLTLWVAVLSLVKLAGVSAIIIYMARRWRYLMVGWFWYLGTLLPVIGLLQVGAQAMADRYTYVPLIGLFIIIAWGATELAAKWHLSKIGLGISAGLVLAALLLCTRAQVKHWKNDFTLFGHALEVTENNCIMNNKYGLAMLKARKPDKAAKHFNEALRIAPRYLEARNNLGQTLLMQGKIDESIACFTEVLRTRTDWPDVYHNLGTAYARQGRYDLAIQNYKEALRLKPDYSSARENLALALKKQAEINEAVEKRKKLP